ncbi:MAG: hypothetical protein ISS28_03065 [Candidatus Cloacimonetes bacterium]|nr:hypothetical protein [Candidatus Cloacimonadota bacterium]
MSIVMWFSHILTKKLNKLKKDEKIGELTPDSPLIKKLMDKLNEEKRIVILHE